MYLHQAQQEELYIYVNRKTREKYGPAAEWGTGSSDKVHQKANVLNAFFTLSLLVGPAFRNRRPLGAVTKSGTRKPSPWVDED